MHNSQKNKMYAVLELLQKSKQRHVKHRNTRSSCRQRSSESSSTQLEEWWDSPFEHEPRIPLAGKDMWAEKLSLTKRWIKVKSIVKISSAYL